MASKIYCCGGACSLHVLEVSRHYRVVVKAFASGQCGPGSIPGRSRSWSVPNNPPNYLKKETFFVCQNVPFSVESGRNK